MKKYLVSLVLVVCVILGSFSVNVFACANQKQLKKETKISICSELSLKKGTIIRTSNFAVLVNTSDPSKPEFENIFKSNQNDIVIQLNEDCQVYLTNGGTYTNKYTYVSDYLNDLNSLNLSNVSVHLVNQQEITNLLLEKSKDKEKYYQSMATSYNLLKTKK